MRVHFSSDISWCLVAIQSLNFSKYNVLTVEICRLVRRIGMEGCSAVKHKERQASTFDAYVLKYTVDDDHTAQLTELSTIGSLQASTKAHFSFSKAVGS